LTTVTVAVYKTPNSRIAPKPQPPVKAGGFFMFGALFSPQPRIVISGTKPGHDGLFLKDHKNAQKALAALALIGRLLAGERPWRSRDRSEEDQGRRTADHRVL
jgi:hypothetical protein